MKKKAQVSIYITFFIVAIVIVTIAAIFAPMGVLFNTKAYEAGQDILLIANRSIANINDDNVRTAVNDNMDSAFRQASFNIEVNQDIFQYSWVFVIILSALVLFIFTRRLIEFGAGGFV